MPKVKGTSTATAIVADRPGRAPMMVPRTTPATASRRLMGVSAWAKCGRSSTAIGPRRYLAARPIFCATAVTSSLRFAMNAGTSS